MVQQQGEEQDVSAIVLHRLDACSKKVFRPILSETSLKKKKKKKAFHGL